MIGHDEISCALVCYLSDVLVSERRLLSIAIQKLGNLEGIEVIEWIEHSNLMSV